MNKKLYVPVNRRQRDPCRTSSRSTETAARSGCHGAVGGSPDLSGWTWMEKIED